VDIPKTMAATLAVNRIVFGLKYLLRPEAAGPSWIGPAARLPGAKVMTRSQGVRDVVLGGGALRAIARGDIEDAQRWIACHAVADAIDLGATWIARDRLPRRGSRIALTVAGGSTLVGAIAAAGLRRRR
jgi:hypothetical protein